MPLNESVVQTTIVKLKKGAVSEEEKLLKIEKTTY